MLSCIINALSKYQSNSPKEFWERVSTENSEDFLSSYKIPSDFFDPSITDFDTLYKIVSEDVIDADDDGYSLLGACEVEIVSLLILLRIKYGVST